MVPSFGLSCSGEEHSLLYGVATQISTETSTHPSPDGTQIAFASDRSGFDAVFVINADGTGEVELTGGSGRQDRSPSWSPDGSQIAFYSTRSSVGEVWVMNADGSNPVNLTGGLTGAQPAWSPDGNHIAFSTDRDGNTDIYLMNADGTNANNLSGNAAVDAEPNWSPDGSKLVFASDRDGGDADVYVMDIDGSNVVRLTTELMKEYPFITPLLGQDEHLRGLIAEVATPKTERVRRSVGTTQREHDFIVTGIPRGDVPLIVEI